MLYLRNSILATLVYYDIFDFPLTALEVHRYLINPGRLNKISGGLGEITREDINNELESLVKAGLAGCGGGYFFLSGREGLLSIRSEKEKISVRKRKKLLRYCRYLVPTPFLRGIIASGSIASGNTTESSDFDVLIIARTGRLYTCRFFLWLISSILKIRRKPGQIKAPDKLCFNHYVTEDHLALPESLFNAQTYASLKPILIGRENFLKLYSANVWINNYLYNFRPGDDFSGFPARPFRLFAATAGFVEKILDKTIGSKLEKIMSKIQRDKIKRNPLTYESGGRVIFTDRVLEFHPRSFEAVVIERYNQGLARLGIVGYEKEKDSGLVTP